MTEPIEAAAQLIEQRAGSIPDRQEIAAEIRALRPVASGDLRERIARIVEPGAFHEEAIDRHKYCSPRRVDVVQAEALTKADALLESQANALRKMEAKFDITKRQKNYQKDRATKANASRADIADGLDHSKARAPLRGTFRHRSENDERPSRRPRV